MISKTGIHALAALAALARLGAGAYAGSGDIAREIGAPRNYLGKLLKTLADAGFLESQKGKGGGFRMARDPAAIPLIKVIEKIERIDRWSGCLMGRGRCSESLSKNRPAAILRRPSGAEEGEAACRGRRGGGSASPANKSVSERPSQSRRAEGIVRRPSDGMRRPISTQYRSLEWSANLKRAWKPRK